MNIVWFSRHKPLPSQITELRRLFGENIEIIQDKKPFSNANEIINRFKEMKGDEMVVVAPLSIIDQLCKKGIKPIWAEMKEVSLEEAEVAAKGRGYRFVKFRRIKRLALEFEEIY